MSKAPEGEMQALRDIKAIMQSHWIGFLFLLPFVVMLAIHHILGFSDAMMIQTPPGEREARTYNMAMCIVFYLGVAAFSIHALSYARRGKLWLLAKLIALVVFWVTILMLA